MFNEALSDFDKSISLKADLWDAYFIRGEIYFNIKADLKNAETNFTNYIEAEIYTRKSDAYLYRGKIFEKEENIDKALLDYNSAIQNNQFNKEAFLLRGILKLNNNDDGCPDLQKYFNLKGKDAQLYLEKYCK